MKLRLRPELSLFQRRAAGCFGSIAPPSSLQRQSVATSSGILLHRPSPGATTCIIVGPFQSSELPDLNQYRACLWWITSPDEVARISTRKDRTQFAQVGVDEPGATLERFVRTDPRHLPTLIVSRAIVGSHPEYDSVIAETHRVLESTHRARITRQQDGFAWQKHVLTNAAAYARSRVPATWAGALRGIPAFVCGAGPSLDISIAALAAHADRAVIFSADSALRALAKRDVTADFAVSTDVAKIPAKCLPEDRLPGRVVLASISPPSWLQAIPENRRYFLSGNQLTDDWFAQQGVSRTEFAVTESCGSTALELAYHLGCAPIYLFGMDLAVDPANQARRHQKDADAALYVNSNYDPTAQLPSVPGNYHETVPCFALGDWRELDARLAARPPGRFFNVNDRGARLRGATVIHPRNFVLDAPPAVKLSPLAALSHTVSGEQSATAALNTIRTVGDRWSQAVPGLQQALDRGGPVALADGFRQLVLDPTHGRVLGAFALKLMPHLVPPIEGDRKFWLALLAEFTELASLARTAGERSTSNGVPDAT
jgi:hypothetical protein